MTRLTRANIIVAGVVPLYISCVLHPIVCSLRLGRRSFHTVLFPARVLCVRSSGNCARNTHSGQINMLGTIDELGKYFAAVGKKKYE